MLSSARDDRLGRLERRSREIDVVEVWSVDAMGGMPYKVGGTRIDRSREGRERE